MDLRQGDCLEIMPTLPSESVDMVLCDPPYGTTQCPWDSIIPLDEMWGNIKRISRRNIAQVFFGSQPFTTKLIVSNIVDFKYSWIWRKNRASGHMHVKNKPLKIHEDVLVFSSGTTNHGSQSKNRMPYNPIGVKKSRVVAKNTFSDVLNAFSPNRTRYHKLDGSNYPNTILDFKKVENTGKFHPTQKPVKLLEYLIKTYTNPGDTVLDFTMGSGSTGVACKNTGRNFIGIELDAEYFEIAKRRIAEMPQNIQVGENVEQTVLFEVAA